MSLQYEPASESLHIYVKELSLAEPRRPTPRFRKEVPGTNRGRSRVGVGWDNKHVAFLSVHGLYRL